MFGGNMKNSKIRELIRKNKIYQYRIAETIGISEFTLCRWFRNELTKDKEEMIISAIEELGAR